MIARGTCALLTAALLLFAAGCLSRTESRPGRTTIKEKGAVLPAKVIGSHFVVQSKWDKHGPWHFLIDTGSSVTLVSAEFAHQYGGKQPPLDPPHVRVRSADGQFTELPAVTLRRISLDTAKFEFVDALVADLSEISNHLGVKIDGVLGFPLFRDAVFTLDYPEAKLRIVSNRFSSGAPGTTIKFNNDQHTPLIPVQLGSTSFIALIDSGSDGPLFLNPRGLETKFVSPPRPGSAVGTLTGNRTQDVARLDGTLSIGPYLFPRPIVDLTDQLSSLGGEILRNFALTFDERRDEVTFFRPDLLPITSPSRRSTGLSFSKGPTYWRVIGVVPGSPAADLGVQVGDLVTRVNGEAVAQWPLERFDPYVKRNPEIVFTFLDGAKEKPIVIPTFDLVP